MLIEVPKVVGMDEHLSPASHNPMLDGTWKSQDGVLRWQSKVLLRAGLQLYAVLADLDQMMKVFFDSGSAEVRPLPVRLIWV